MLKDFAKAIHEADLPILSDDELLSLMAEEDAQNDYPEPDSPNEYDGDPDYEQ